MAIVREVPETMCGYPGEVLFDSGKLLEILRSVTSETISISVEDSRALIKAGSAKFTIPTMPAEEFPPSPVFDAESFYSVSAADMANIVKRSVFQNEKAASPALGGVWLDFDFGQNVLHGCTTDGKGLSVSDARLTLTGSPDQVQTASVPMKAMKLLGSSLGEWPVDLIVTANVIRFRIGGTVISSQLLTGKFLNWRRFFQPGVWASKVDIVPSSVLAAIRQAMVTTALETKRVAFQFHEGNLSLSSKGNGESSIDVPISYSGDTTINLIPDYLQTALSLIDKAATATIEFENADGPIRMICSDGFRYMQATCEA